MTAVPLSGLELAELLRTFRRTAFYLEAQQHYALGYETASLERFTAGRPVPPPQIGWWRDWLAQVTDLVRQGKQITRVRIIAEPPSDYQRWEQWALPWHLQAGERIGHLSRDRAAAAGLPLEYDWWLLDDERLVTLRYSGTGELLSRTLINGPGTIARHTAWRDLAVRNAAPAGVPSPA